MLRALKRARSAARMTALLASLLVLCNVVIWQVGRSQVVDDASELSGTYDAVIVPGTLVYIDSSPSSALQQRIDQAVELYDHGVVDHLLVSGDNGIKSYDEPTTMRRQAHRQGVPLADITLDYAGFSTWDTCVRAKEIFGVDRAVFVTQAPFANRAAALCEKAGIDVDVLALQRRVDQRVNLRERLAAVKATYEIIAGPEPRFLGNQLGLTGSVEPANPDPVLGES